MLDRILNLWEITKIGIMTLCIGQWARFEYQCKVGNSILIILHFLNLIILWWLYKKMSFFLGNLF